MSDPLLRVDNVTKRFGGLKAVDDVTLSIPKGSIVGLIGPNGSGKTTLFNVICGIYKPDSGKVYFDDSRIDGINPNDVYVKGLVRTFQIPKLFFGLTVLDNMLLAARGNIGENFLNVFKAKNWHDQEVKLTKKALGILDLLQLDQSVDYAAKDLSGGQMKLLEIGMALMSDPKMMLLDEPIAGVNPVLSGMILEEVQTIRSKLGVTYFIIEHKVEVLVKYADWIYVMNKGQLVTQGKPEEVVNDKVVIDVYLGEA
ncbi:MAG: ABC transporter ATP-binding protein [archaeon]|nr:ABC transporter ATP-binding protein [archaeon]MCP8314110.1 ABC transporter ATP-binding protein [archaeon]MCP8316106.1 ABC transporter ATP-binding protein [archaeon]MCP8321305.1 ABC transporter ATP-binding protein [archaeon]